jgi:F-type H+-transporting ATPase subunit delta
MAKDPRISGYANALLAIATAEDVLDRVEDELFRFSQALGSEMKLRDALVDPSLPADHRSKMVAELLGDKATDHTVNFIRFVVEQGRARELPEIIEQVVKQAAETRGQVVAEVRTAAPLSDQQKQQLIDALEKQTGRKVELKVILDQSVIGGLIAQVGDIVFDASVKRRLNGLRERIGSR